MLRFPVLSNIRFLTRDIKFNSVIGAQRCNPSQQSSGFGSSTSPALSSSHELDQAMKDLSAYDHFGILSLGSRESVTSAGTIDDRSFLDHLLRAESTSGLNGYQIPTIAEVSELGGHSESMIFDHFDVDNSILQVNEEFFMDTATLSDGTSQALQERESSIPSSAVPLVSNSRRMVISEQQRQLRSKMVRDQPTTSEDYYTEVQSTSGPRLFEPPQDRSTYASVDELLLAISSADIQELRLLLCENLWPEQREIARYLPKIFRFIVDKSENCGEAMMFFRDYASCNRRSFISDDVVIYYAIRNLRDNGLQSTIELFPMFRNMFIARAPNHNKKLRHYEDNLRHLCTESFDRGGWEAAERLMQTLIDTEFARNARLFLQVAPTTSFSKGNGFDEIFSKWSNSSTRNAATDGVEVFWRRIFTEADGNLAARNAGRLLGHCKKFDHPLKCIAELLCCLVHLDNVELAKIIFSKISVSGNFFRVPLSRYTKEENGLQFIERLAELVSFGLYGERSRGRKKTLSAESNVLSTEMESALDSFCGISKHSKKSTSSFKKSNKKKTHKVDEESLHGLTEEIQDAWIALCEKSQHLESLERLVIWSQTHNLEMSDNLMKRVRTLKSSGSKLL